MTEKIEVLGKRIDELFQMVGNIQQWQLDFVKEWMQKIEGILATTKSQTASVGEAQAEAYADVHYGGTINLGDYNNRKINISVHGIPPKDIDTILDELEQKFDQRENKLRRSQS